MLLLPAVWRSTITCVALYLAVAGSIPLVGSSRPGPASGLTRANNWLEHTTRSTWEALLVDRPRPGRVRANNDGRRTRLMQQHSGNDRGRRLRLMQQDSSRGSSAFDEWEAGGASGEEEEEEEDWKAGRGRGGSSREEMMAKMEKKMSNEKPRPEDEPHPLRTQDWKLEMKPRPWKIVEQEVSFHRNGTVITGAGDAGTWWFDVGGLYWDVNITMGTTPTVLHHKAELHWNVFGDQPRMFRGTVTRDRLPKSLLPPWLFRPVVGAFVGAGVGNDTSDTSYAHRQHTGVGGEDEAMPPRLGPQTDRY